MLLSRRDKRQILRTQLWAVLHHGHGATGHAFNFFLVVLIIISVALIPLEFFPEFRQYEDIVHIIEAVIVAFFSVEYILRIYAAPKRLRYIFSFAGVIDLLSIIPFYAGIFGTEYVRILRLVRLFKLGEIEAAAMTDESEVMQRDIGLMSGETVEYVVTKSPIVLLFGILPPLLSFTFGLGTLLMLEGPAGIAIAIMLFFFALIFLWKTWLDYSYDVLYLTNYRLIFQDQHILGRSINHVSYPSITNVKPTYPTVVSFILRYGSLVIDTAAEHPGQIQLHTVRKHEKAAQIIMQKCFTMQQQHAGISVPPVMDDTRADTGEDLPLPPA